MYHRLMNPEKRIGVFCIAILFSSACLHAQSMKWLTDHENAKQRALAENKLILADFWASWCGPCIAMDQKTWNKPSVISASKHLVSLRLNYDREFRLNSHYGITAIPAMLILDGFGNKLFHIEGFKSESEMGSVLRSLPSNMTPIYDLLRESQAAPDSTELRIAVGDKYQLMRLPQVSNKYYEEVLHSKRIKNQPTMEYHIKTRMALNHHLLGELKKAKNLFEECLENEPESPDRPMQLFLLTKIYLLDKDEDDARKYFEMLREEFPNDNHVKLAQDLFKR